MPNRNQPVRSLLVGARNNGHQRLTNRVVGVNGKLADLPGGPDQQRRQLLAEGVPFSIGGCVDFDRISPLALARPGATADVRARGLSTGGQQIEHLIGSVLRMLLVGRYNHSERLVRGAVRAPTR